MFKRWLDNRVLKALVSLGVNVHAYEPGRFNDLTSPLRCAVRTRDHQKLEILLSSPTCDVDEKSLCDGTTPLMAAVRKGYSSFCKTLLEKGANPNFDVENEEQFRKQSPWFAAVWSRKMDLIQLFIDHGVDVNVTCRTDKGPNTGYSAIHFAGMAGNEELVQFLLNAGALPDERNKLDQNTLLSYVAGNAIDPRHSFLGGFSHNTFQLLLAKGCNVNNAYKDGDTPLLYACFNNSNEMALELLDHGADPDWRNDSNASPLWYAVYGNLPKVVQRLLEFNVPLDVESRGSDLDGESDEDEYLFPEPMTPFGVAAEDWSFGICWILIQAGYEMKNHHPDFLEFEGVDRKYLEKEIKWFRQNLNQPLSLSRLCRNTVRKQLGQGIKQKVEELELPHILKDYILLKKLTNLEVPEKWYDLPDC